MGDYDINVKGLCIYEIREAESREDAIIQAIEYFCNDDLFLGTDEADNVTEDDCTIMWFKEY